MANYSSSFSGAAIDSAVGRANSTDVTAGTVAASKAVVVDSNKDITGFRNITLTGQLTAATISLTGDTDIGDAAGDTVTITAQVDSNVVPSADNTYDLGSSTKEWKDIYIDGTAYLDAINFNGTAITSTAAELNILDGVTSTAAELNILDGVTSTAAEINILDGVTSTATELNIMDGGTSATSTTLADADRVVVNDGGTMKQVALTDFETYFESALDTLSNVTSVGTLTSLTVGSTSINKITHNHGSTALEIENLGSKRALYVHSDVDSGQDNPLVEIHADNTGFDQEVLRIQNDGVNSSIQVLDNGSEVFTIENGGNVGIGTSSPSQMLHINGAVPTILFTDGTNGDLGFLGDAADFLTSGDTDADAFGIRSEGEIRLGTGGNNTRMLINSSGNVGIGQAASEGVESLLHVRGASAGSNLDVIRIDNDAGNTSTEAGILFETGQLSMARISAMNEGSDLGALRFWTSGSSNTPSERMRIDSSGKVGIGTSSPDGLLHAHTATAGSVTASTDADELIVENSAHGGISILVPDDQTSCLYFGQASSNRTARVDYDGNANIMHVGTTKASGQLQLQSANGTTGVTLDASSRVGIGTSSPTSPFMVSAEGVDGAGLGRFQSTASSGTPEGINVYYPSVAPDNDGWSFLHQDSSATRFVVRNDGDVENHDNDYGATSDERIKDNITDAKSQWDDIKALRVRNFQRKDDIDQYGADKAMVQIGVIAQEVEPISSGLIEEKRPSDYEKDVLKIDGDVKVMKYSVLYMKAIKCLQEAMEKIETLETKVEALENA